MEAIRVQRGFKQRSVVGTSVCGPRAVDSTGFTLRVSGRQVTEESRATSKRLRRQVDTEDSASLSCRCAGLASREMSRSVGFNLDKALFHPPHHSLWIPSPLGAGCCSAPIFFSRASTLVWQRGGLLSRSSRVQIPSGPYVQDAMEMVRQR